MIEPRPLASPGPTADERKSLEWLLSVGSKVTVSVGGKQVDIVGGGNLPEGALAVVGFDCQGSQAVDDESVENLRNLPVVASWARFWKTRLTDAGVAKLTAIPALAGINDLSLGDCALTEKGFALLAHFSKLRTLYLDHTPITREGMAHVGRLSGLTWLRLTGTQVDATSLASLRGMGLESLYLNLCARVDDGGMEHLATLAELANLSLHGTAVTDAGLEKLATLMSLRSLYLGSTKVTSAGVKKLAAALPQCRIEWGGGVIEPRPVADALRASVAVFLKSGAGVAILEGDKPRNITSVDELRDHDRVCTIAIRAPGGRNLLADPAFVAALKAFPADRWSGRHSTLYFNGHLTAQQIYDTLQIPFLQEVRTLGIADGLPDGALKYVGQLPKLTSFGLYRNPNVSEAVLKQIAALSGLIRLDLDHSTIDSAGLAALARARLQSLHIVESSTVDDAAIKHLAAITTLKFVVLKGTKISESGIKKLAAALPECRIEWDGGVIEPLSQADQP